MEKNEDSQFQKFTTDTNFDDDLEATTVDPTYVIRLIRQLLPDSLKRKNQLNASEKRGESKSDSASGENHKNGFRTDITKIEVREELQTQNKAPRTESKGTVRSAETEEEKVEKPRGELGAPTELDMEEAGCLLWDLAASETQAEFLVKNHILEVLFLILQSSDQPVTDRMREICLGILGNLACHKFPQKAMVEIKGLIPSIVRQIFEQDPPSITEACRVLCAGLHGLHCSAWMEALGEKQNLERILWVAANTAHTALLDKSLEVLLALVDGKEVAPTSTLGALLGLGLPQLLSEVMESEIRELTESRASHSDSILDTALQIAEALSLSDDCAGQLAQDERLFGLACQVVRLSANEEIGPSAITASVLLANLMAEDDSLLHSVAQDVALASCLMALLPQVADDSGARNAIWSILGRTSARLAVPKNGKEDMGVLAGMTGSIAGGSGVLVEDLEQHWEEDWREDEAQVEAGQDLSASTSRGLEAKLTTLRNMVTVMERWAETKEKANGHTSQLLSAVGVASGEMKRQLEKRGRERRSWK